MVMHKPKHTTLQSQNTKDKEKILKADRKEKHHFQRNDH